MFDYVIDQSAVTDKFMDYQDVIQPEPKVVDEQKNEDTESGA